MRLRFPTHISVPKTVAFAAALALVQQFEHTTLAFSLLCFTFIVVSVVTFNAAGGMNRPTGSYVFFFSTLTVSGAVVVKALLGEPGQTYLEEPLLTLSVYNVGIFLMLGTVLLKNRLLGSVQGLGKMLNPGPLNISYSAAGCLIVGLIITVANSFVAGGNGSVISALNQVNLFFPLGLILATVGVVQDSHGERSFSAFSLAASVVMFVIGMAAFSKQALFTPIVAWVIGAIYGRLRIRWFHVVTFAAVIYVMTEFITPVAQIGRNMIEDASGSERLKIFAALVMDSRQTRIYYENSLTAAEASEGRHHYYEHTIGLGDRLAMFQTDDGLISWIDQNGPVGYAPIGMYLGNLVPHVLNPNKDAPGAVHYGGNYYAHLIGGYLAPEDYLTGISFGVLGEAFAMGRLQGVILITPILWFFVFLTSDLISGDLRSSPWGLLPMLEFTHTAPESLVGGLISYLWLANMGIVLGIWFCVTVAPILGSILGTSLTRGQNARALREGSLNSTATPRGA